MKGDVEGISCRVRTVSVVVALAMALVAAASAAASTQHLATLRAPRITSFKHKRGNVVGTARVVIVVPRTMPRGAFLLPGPELSPRAQQVERVKLAYADVLSAALPIAGGPERGLYAVALTPAQRLAILSQLEAPWERLAEPRRALARDHRDRRR